MMRANGLALTIPIGVSGRLGNLAKLRTLARPWSAGIHSPWILLLCKLFIGLVSCYDIFLTIKYVTYLPDLELNPVGRWLMSLDSGPTCHLDQIAGFISCKFAGNFITLAAIEGLCYWKKQAATCVAVTVALAQLLLLYFLTSTP